MASPADRTVTDIKTLKKLSNDLDANEFERLIERDPKFKQIAEKMNMPSSPKVRSLPNPNIRVDPSLLEHDVVKNINLSNFRKTAPQVAKRFGKIFSKALGPASVALDLVDPQIANEGSDIVPGRKSFDELYPKGEVVDFPKETLDNEEKARLAALLRMKE